MTRKFDLRFFISLTLPWLLLWYLPWTTWLDNLPWLRLGLAGLIFIAPGTAVSMILIGNRFTLLSHVTSGLTLSIFLVSSLGVMGRIVHLPFAFIKPTFFAAGLFAFLALTLHWRSTQQLFKPKNYSLLFIVLFLFVIVFGALISLTSRFGGDDYTYLAYLTNFQHSTRLSFGEVIFGSGDLEPFRFWLAMFPMNQAFLAELSGLHGVLLLGYYLKPVLVIISMLALYNLFKDLLRSDHHAIIALLLQAAFLFPLLGRRQPGNVFFLLAIEDKSFAAFTLAPVFFLAVTCCLESLTLRRGIFVLLCGWCLALTHPIILAYTIFIASMYVAIVTIPGKNYKIFSILLILLFLIISPSASLRFPSLYGARIRAGFDLETALTASPDKTSVGDRISFIEGTPFYGFNPDQIRLQFDEGLAPSWLTSILSWLFLLLLVLGFLWSLPKLKGGENAIAAFVAGSSLLVLLCAIPYTGWLVGYFVSARMLWRAPWLFPIGLVGAILIMDMVNVILSKVKIESRREAITSSLTLVFVLAICSVLIRYSSGYQIRMGRITFDEMNGYRDRLKTLAEIGDYIETNVEEPSIFLASYDMMNYLPGLSSKSKVVFFRNSLHTPHSVNQSGIEKILSTSEEFTIQRRVQLLSKYHIRNILIEDASVHEYYAEYPEFFNLQEFGDHWLIEYKEAIP